MICARCGTEIAEGTPVCPQCGALFGVPQQPRAEGQQPPPPGQGVTPQYPYPQQYPQYPPYAPPNDVKAIVSLVCGILSLVCCYVGILPGIVAVVLGHLSRSNIRKSMGQLQGDGMALAGLSLGYVSCVLSPLMIAAIMIPNIFHARAASNEASAVGSLRTVNTAQITYQATYPDKGFAPNLATLGGNCGTGSGNADHACLIDQKLGADSCTGNTWCTKSGYKFIVVAAAAEPRASYVVTAIPTEPGKSGHRAYCSTEEGMIYFDQAVRHRTTPYTAEECKALPQL